MKTIKRFFRLLYICYILFKYGLDDILLKSHFFRSIRFLRKLSPTRFRKIRHIPPGKRLREALEKLGPIFVKFGQMLSTRVDALPQDFIQELVFLQDQVPPFSGITAERILTHALTVPLETVFQSFDSNPLASASIAQVHAGILLNGDSVVVKIVRPNVQKMIDRDIALMKSLAFLAHYFWKGAHQFKPREMVNEFEKSLLAELDLMREAANASQLRRNFKDSDTLYVPEIVWPLTKNNVLVMERMYGIPISNIEQLKQHGINLKTLAEKGVEIFFTQVFRDCFFHADMHPGNIWVSVHHPEQPQYLAMDFGIMGSLSPHDQYYLAENFLAIFNRDYRRVAELHQDSGWIPKDVRIEEFEAAIRTVCEPIFEKPIKDISFGNMLFRLFQTAKRFKIDIQPQLLLLQKTLLNVESLGKQLYPELDLWSTAKPFLENWLKNNLGPKALLKKLKKQGPLWLEKLPELPHFIIRTLKQNELFLNAGISRKGYPNSAFLTLSKTSFRLGLVIGMLITLIGLLIWRQFYG